MTGDLPLGLETDLHVYEAVSPWTDYGMRPIGALKIPPPTEMLSAKPISSARLVFGRWRPPAHCHRHAGRRLQPSAGGFLCCQVPDGFTAVMSADTWEKKGPNTYFFQMSQPIPSYLVALAIGDLVSAEVGPR